MLLVESPPGLLISGISITKIRFEFDNLETDGSPLAPILGFSHCNDSIIQDCCFSFTRGEPLIGVRIDVCSQFQLERCVFDTAVFGVWVTGNSSAVSCLHNEFRIAGANGSHGGSIAIFLQDAIGASRIIGNYILGYLIGISLNRNTFTVGAAPISRANGSIVAENQIIRFTPPVDSSESKAFGIVVAASDCLIEGNELSHSSHIFAGINVTGNRCNIERNRVRFSNRELITQPSIGILLGLADSERTLQVEGGRIDGNYIIGPQNAMVVFQNSGVNISDNQISSVSDQVGFGIVLIDVDNASVNGNLVENALFAAAVSEGNCNSFVSNQFNGGGAALTALQQTAFEFTQNRIEDMRNWGFLGLQFIDKVAVCGNRFASCGYQRTPAIGIGVSGVFGELSIESCEVINTGISPDASVISQPARQIIADLVLECRIQGNLVTYSNSDLLVANLEDRSLWLRGLRESLANGDDTRITFGFSAQVLDNKFLGPGFSALVEFQKIQVNDSVFVRFERVFFSNNFCWHVSTAPDSNRATVRLAGRNAVVMGNQIKATTPFPCVDFQQIPSVFVGNIADCGTLNFTEFPAPETRFNIL